MSRRTLLTSAVHSIFGLAPQGEACAKDYAEMSESSVAQVRALGKQRAGLKCSRWGPERVIDAVLADEYEFWEFRESVKEAEAEAEISRLVTIQDAAGEHWQAAAAPRWTCAWRNGRAIMPAVMLSCPCKLVIVLIGAGQAVDPR